MNAILHEMHRECVYGYLELILYISGYYEYSHILENIKVSQSVIKK